MVGKKKPRKTKRKPRNSRHDRDAYLRRKYGLSLEEYGDILAAQGGRCGNPGCRTKAPGGRYNQWHVDHDHVTGDVRGLLCNACNLALGQLGDDPERIEGLRDYLNQERS